MYEQIVVVTRKTRLEELIQRFNSRAQAKFYIEHGGSDFSEYEREHEVYQQALASVKEALDEDLKIQVMDRSFVSTYLFSDRDIILVLGQDGLVANTAKYVAGQPIIAINPDPERYDGLLLPFDVPETRTILDAVQEDQARTRSVTLAEAVLEDGQRLLAFNDLFIGPASHVSARYRIRHEDRSEVQSSSGIIVSTGAGSTGWLSSLFNMAAGMAAFGGEAAPRAPRLAWDDSRLAFIVREPFKSRHSQADLVAGLVQEGGELILESTMPSGGVIFSDGIEKDYLAFNSGAIARVRVASQSASLVVAGRSRRSTSRRRLRGASAE